MNIPIYMYIITSYIYRYYLLCILTIARTFITDINKKKNLRLVCMNQSIFTSFKTPLYYDTGTSVCGCHVKTTKRNHTN